MSKNVFVSNPAVNKLCESLKSSLKSIKLNHWFGRKFLLSFNVLYIMFKECSKWVSGTPSFQ